jgi:hypothetical protein
MRKAARIANRLPLEEWIAKWRVFRDELNETWAWAIVAQEDGETAAIWRTVINFGVLDHTAWRQLLWRATDAEWADLIRTVFEIDTLPIGQPYTGTDAEWATAISTVFDIDTIPSTHLGTEPPSIQRSSAPVSTIL